MLALSLGIKKTVTNGGVLFCHLELNRAMDDFPDAVVVYLLRDSGSRRTYIGATKNMRRRIRQHNGELKGGAKYTSRSPGGWSVAAMVSGFVDAEDKNAWCRALSFEWHAKRRARGVTKRLVQMKKMARAKGLMFHEFVCAVP